MIRYSLVCGDNHVFESWFRDSAAFDSVIAAGHVTCPACGSVSVRKALMAPSVVMSRRDRPPRNAAVEPVATAPEPSTDTGQPIALVDERERRLREMMRALHREITSKADDVGRAFAAEARRIHEGEVPKRSIYGEASAEQVRSLLEDGIPLLPMPQLPDDHN